MEFGVWGLGFWVCEARALHVIICPYRLVRWPVEEAAVGTVGGAEGDGALGSHMGGGGEGGGGLKVREGGRGRGF